MQVPRGLGNWHWLEQPLRRGSTAGLSREGASAGRRPFGEAVDTPDQNLGRGTGVVECTLVGGMLKDALGDVAGALGICESGGEGVPHRIAEDLLRVCGYDLA